ncbi:Signal transduction histidine kinase [Parabacteroides chinchillae]|uniref:histidine kinase n=1 Tax=Parabacteroides chinchillae TaxID=871327 RepID=A0A8G2F402_9BACT|nr:ATP-binding protein [Parabacteroides chinchillae]SEG26041.1 Signal transduction histidine kinase [Parabacteroides chinchillae]
MFQSIHLKIKTKLTYGIGLLFAMIVLLGCLSVENILNMSSDTQNILADNYNSLLYSRRMLDALERIKTDPVARSEFEKNLELQKKNITEVDENAATSYLAMRYESMLKDRNDTTIQRVRIALNQVMSLNMASIYRKSQVAESTAHQALLWIGVIGVLCILIAFVFLIKLPRSIDAPIRKLKDGIMGIANHNYEKRLDLGGYEEFAEVANSFNRMAEHLAEYRKSTLADIIQAKKYIEAIVNSINEPIIGLNGDRSILFANDEALTILNLKRENVIGKSAAELALKNDLLRRLIRELIQPNEKNEPLKIYADNKESYFQAKYIPIHVSDEDTMKNQYVGDVILLKNITEFKELDSAKTTFISTISHELKTPIAAIMMSLKLLDDNRVGDMNDEQKTLTQSIKESSDRLLEITGELLKMTQVETGKLQLNPKITKPIELIDYAIKANRVQAERFGCHIEVEYPEKISKLFVDSEKIAWVLTNLLSNAIHYTPENGRIIIGARQLDKAIDIFVQDFGKGIDPRYHQSIFDRYFRVPGTKVQGSGLGLAISKDFVEAHGGTIRVDSEVGKGSTFVIRFVI